jgi:8-oxo-dGTP pyrophosphatase MutT (NUDIX family)
MSQTPRPWKILSSKLAFKEKWFPVRQDTIELPSGRIIDEYFVWESPSIVHVVPVTTDGRWVLVRQYRHAIGSIMMQFPAGAANQGEAAESAARREMKEETGYDTDQPLIALGSFAPYPTKLTGKHAVFLAPAARPITSPAHDEMEETEVVTLNPEELLASVAKPQLYPADLLAITLLAARHTGVLRP